MKDPYLYPHTELLKNLANIQDGNMLSCMEAEYTSLRLAELVMKESASCFISFPISVRRLVIPSFRF